MFKLGSIGWERIELQFQWICFTRLDLIDPDFVSLNIYQPCFDVPTANRVLAQLQSGTERHQALADRINKRFYFRAGALFRQLTTIRSMPQLALQAKIAAGLFISRS
jgi:hypothetical protein